MVEHPLRLMPADIDLGDEALMSEHLVLADNFFRGLSAGYGGSPARWLPGRQAWKKLQNPTCL
jgi:hypothetical protein